VPVEYSLSDRRLSAIVRPEAVKEEKEARLVSFSLLPFLGAGNQEDEGYVFLPDGSGAVMNFNNKKTGDRLILETLYGDLSKPDLYRQPAVQPVLIPCMGFHHQKSNASLFAFAADGAFGGQITANTAGQETGLNYAYYTFLYRSYEFATLMDRTWDAKTMLMCDEKNTGAKKYAMEYTFLAPENAGLTGMAEACRDYVLPDREPTGKQPLGIFADIYMGVEVKTNFLGIPYHTLRTLTTFEEAQSIADSLAEAVSGSLSFRGLGVSDDGAFGGKINEKVRVSGKLGGLKGLKALQNTEGLAFYPQFNLISFNKSGSGAGRLFGAAYNIKKEIIERNTFRLASRSVSDVPSFRLVRAEKMEANAKKLADSLKKNKIETAALTDIGQGTYPDFTKNHIVRLEETAEKIAGTTGLLSQNARLMLEAPVYTLFPYAAAIQHLPVTSSRYNLIDAEVPFLSMVLSGYLPFAGEDINLCGDTDTALLRAIENGSQLSLALTAADYTKVASTAVNGLYASQYSLVEKAVKELYQKQKDALDAVYGLRITGYDINGSCRAVTYENGVTVVVNYGETPQAYKGSDIPAKGYLTIPVKEQP